MSKTQTILKTERRRSREIFARAERVLVGGVNSPVRAFRSVGGEPLVIDRAGGQFLYDADGNELLDYVCSWGAILLGHSNPAIADAIADQARRGTSFRVATALELEPATSTLGIAGWPGATQVMYGLTLKFPYNDPEAVEKVFATHKGKIAAVIVEPIAANMGVVLPESGFLKGLREITQRDGALHIVDEV